MNMANMASCRTSNIQLVQMYEIQTYWKSIDPVIVYLKHCAFYSVY